MDTNRHCISKKQGGNGFFSTGKKLGIFDCLNAFFPYWHFFYKQQLDPDSDDLTPLAKSPPEVTLPEPELSNLKEISDLLNTAHTLHEKDKLAAFVLTEVRLLGWLWWNDAKNWLFSNLLELYW